jgi:hypothetical protein
MRSIVLTALSLAPDVNDWLAKSQHPRILHVFDHACNLVNERGEVLSIVTRQIGNGPFNLVVAGDVCFSDHIHLESPISTFQNHMTVGSVTILMDHAKSWSPRPDWEELHIQREKILAHLTQLQITNQRNGGLDAERSTTISLQSPTSILQFFNSLLSNLSSALANKDISTAKDVTSKLAGLGQGLTPSGDDFILGAMYATWIIHPPEMARNLAEEITNNAAPLTTSLSAAWLRSAGRGEAGVLWHDFFNALFIGDSSAIQLQITNLLSMGHTSGADALAGFIGTMLNGGRTAATILDSELPRTNYQPP